MANPILTPGATDFILQISAPVVGVNQQVADGAFLLQFSGSLPTSASLFTDSVPFVYVTSGGEEPPTYNATQFFLALSF